MQATQQPSGERRGSNVGIAYKLRSGIAILEEAYVDFTLTEEQSHWRSVAQSFAETVIKPDVLRRDRLPTAEERIPWDWIREADKRGLRTLGVPKAFGGAGADIVSMCLADEELAVGDLGVA